MLLFSQRLKEVRKANGLTQQELGDKIGVTKVSICCYEKGTRTPTLDTLIDLANELGVDFTYLIGNDKYVVAEGSEDYGINLGVPEIELLKTLRKHPDIYNKLLSDTERILKIIEQKIR